MAEPEKTTLLRILTTMLRPSSGTAFIDGFEIGRQNINIRQRIGIVKKDNHFDRYSDRMAKSGSSCQNRMGLKKHFMNVVFVNF